MFEVTQQGREARAAMVVKDHHDAPTTETLSGQAATAAMDMARGDRHGPGCSCDRCKAAAFTGMQPGGEVGKATEVEPEDGRPMPPKAISPDQYRRPGLTEGRAEGTPYTPPPKRPAHGSAAPLIKGDGPMVATLLGRGARRGDA